jgi:hypothetical protein
MRRFESPRPSQSGLQRLTCEGRSKRPAQSIIGRRAPDMALAARQKILDPIPLVIA